MATRALENMFGGSSKQPISTHKAFPIIVALWFAALLGLGSLVVPVAVIEQIVAATGLPKILSFTAPPLGMTARALIALAFALAGGAAGLFIARQVAKAHSKELDESGRTPIAAHDELGSEGFDAPRRRSLFVDDSETPREVYEEAPLPVAEVAMPHEVTVEEEQVDELLEELETEISQPVPSLFDAELEDQAWKEDIQLDETLPLEENSLWAEDNSLAAEEDEQGIWVDEAWLAKNAPGKQAADMEFVEEEFFQDEPEMDDRADDQDADCDAGEVLQFSPPSFAKEEPVVEGPAVEENAELAPNAAISNPFLAERVDAEILDAPLDELGLVQLTERLGASIIKRRSLQAENGQIAAEAEQYDLQQESSAAFEAARADDAAQAMADYFNTPEPVSQHGAQFSPEGELPTAAATGEDARENERALRDALLNLQRMSEAG